MGRHLLWAYILVGMALLAAIVMAGLPARAVPGPRGGVTVASTDRCYFFDGPVEWDLPHGEVWSRVDADAGFVAVFDKGDDATTATVRGPMQTPGGLEGTGWAHVSVTTA